MISQSEIMKMLIFIFFQFQEIKNTLIINIDMDNQLIITKELPGIKVPLDEEVLDELKQLDPKRFQKTVPFFGGHPSSLVKKDQNSIFAQLNPRKQSPYLVCQKTDGVRYLLLITNQNHYFISREGKSMLIAYKSQCRVAKNWQKNPWGELHNVMHILDGEMINDKLKNGDQKLRYLIFDALVVFNKIIIKKTLKERLEQCQKFMRCNEYLLSKISVSDQQYYKNSIEVKLKDFFRLTCSSFVSSEVMAKKKLDVQPTTVQFLQKYYIKALPHQNDGIIFNHEQKEYLLGLNSGYIKWKPAEYNTVDFLIVPNTKLEGQLEKRVLDLYLGWRDSEMATYYRMMFYNFTVVSAETYKRLEQQFQIKYTAAFNENPDLVMQDSFGIIAQCKYEKMQLNSQPARLFKNLLSSTKEPQQIRQYIMRQQLEDKQIDIIKRIQGEPCTKFWQIFRIRSDKNLPNNHDVAKKIEQSIKDDIKFDDLVKKNIQLIDKTRIP